MYKCLKKLKIKYIVIENTCDGRSIILITESQNKAFKIVDILQKLNDMSCENILYEVESYTGFKGLKYFDYNGKFK